MIVFSKIPGERYDAKSFKTYTVTRAGQNIGTLEQAYKGWEVLNANLERVAKHTTIKAAVRVARKVL